MHSGEHPSSGVRSQSAAVALILILFVANPVSGQCGGDCDGDGSVDVAEIITLVNIALRLADVASCLPGDTSGDGTITVDEIVAAVQHALNGCSATAACGNGVVDAGEQCDFPDDATCPGRCAAPGAVTYTCHAGCAMTLGACSSAQDPTCPGQCVTSQAPECSCLPDNPPTCPTPQPLPHQSAFLCDPCVDISAARLFYREEGVSGELFQETTIAFKNYVDPQHTMITVTTTTRRGTQAPVVEDMPITLAGVNSSWLGLIRAHSMLVCGWAAGCDDAGHVLISNGQQFTWTPAGSTVKYTYSCSGCGGGAGRVGATWANARCGTQFGRPTYGLCRDSVGSTDCCGCPGDTPCPSGAPNCVDGGCLP